MTIDQLPALASGAGQCLVPVSKDGADYKAKFVELTGAGADLGAGIDIPSGANIDSYLDDGTYRVASATIAASLAGAAPTTSSGFKLFVLTQNVNYKWQIAILNQTSAPILKRWYNSGTFGPWIRSLDESDFPVAIANGGTGATTVAGIKAALGIDGALFKFTNISTGASLMPIGNARRGVLVTAGPSANDKSLHIFSSTTGGTMTVSTVFPGSNITVSGDSSGGLSIVNGGQNQITAFALYVSGA